MSLLHLRKIQYITSSYGMQLFLNKKIIGCQLIFFSVSICFTVIGKYYSLERYHMYGCRNNYRNGFPIICPPFRRPNGIDSDSAMMFFGSFIFIVLMIIFPILYETKKWKSLLLDDIYSLTENSLKSIGLTDVKYIEKGFDLILSLEGLSDKHHYSITEINIVKKRSFLVHIGSCIWAELYLLYHFKNYKTLIAFITILLITILFPLFLPIANTFSSTIGLMISCILFYMLPCFSGILIVILTASIFSTKMNLFILIFLILWTSISIGTLLFAYFKDRKDEIHFVRNSYSKKLHNKLQVESCLYLRGYRRFLIFFYLSLIIMYTFVFYISMLNLCFYLFALFVLVQFVYMTHELVVLYIFVFQIHNFRHILIKKPSLKQCWTIRKNDSRTKSK